LLLQLRSAAHDLPRAVLIGPDVRILCLGVDLGQLFPQRVLVKDTPASAGCAPFQLLRFESVLPALSPRRDFSAQSDAIILLNIRTGFYISRSELRKSKIQGPRCKTRPTPPTHSKGLVSCILYLGEWVGLTLYSLPFTRRRRLRRTFDATTMEIVVIAHNIAHQSPNRTRGVMPFIGCTDSVKNPVSPTSRCDTTFPDGSMKPEIPVSAARANQRRVSAARSLT